MVRLWRICLNPRSILILYKTPINIKYIIIVCPFEKKNEIIYKHMNRLFSRRTRSLFLDFALFPLGFWYQIMSNGFCSFSKMVLWHIVTYNEVIWTRVICIKSHWQSLPQPFWEWNLYFLIFLFFFNNYLYLFFYLFSLILCFLAPIIMLLK